MIIFRDSVLVMLSPPKVTRRQKLDCLSYLAQGLKQKEVVDLTRVSRSTICRAKSKLCKYGDIEGGRKKQGRKAVLTQPILDV